MTHDFQSQERCVYQSETDLLSNLDHRGQGREWKEAYKPNSSRPRYIKDKGTECYCTSSQIVYREKRNNPILKVCKS